MTEITIDEKCQLTANYLQKMGVTIQDMLNYEKNLPKETVLKDAEILEFKSEIGHIWAMCKNGYMCTDGDRNKFYNLNSMLHYGHSVDSGYFTIHKVKRISTGHVFEVGKEYVHNLIGKICIGSFKLLSTDIIAIEKTICIAMNLQNLQPLTTPILITHDGVSITDGNLMVFGVNTDNFNHTFGYAVNNIKNAGNGVIWFSSYDTLNAYISKHKPQYSLADVEKAISNANQCSVQELMEDILFELQNLHK